MYGKFLAQNLKQTLELTGQEDAVELEEAGKNWLEKNRKRFHERDEFPSHGTIDNWRYGIRKNYTLRLLHNLCAYLLFGRYDRPIPENFEHDCMTMAQRMVDTESALQFRLDYALPRSPYSNKSLNKISAATEIPSEEEISAFVSAAIGTTQAAQAVINHKLKLLANAPAKLGLDFLPVGLGVRQKSTATDMEVEDAAVEFLEQKYKDKIQCLGEERLKRYKQNFPGWSKRYCALIDAMDGTDMVAMDINLWCTAIVIYDNVRSKIITSVVGFPSGKFCVAREDRADAWFTKNAEDVFPNDNNTLAGPSDVKEVARARIGFYGQKPANFLKIATDPKFTDLISFIERKAANEEVDFRMFNFAGNPQIIRLVDRPVGFSNTMVVEGIDAIIEKHGQRAHDFVPAAFIALKMQASMFDLYDQPINENDLAEMVRCPDTRQKGYVIAATEALALALAQSLTPP